MSAIIEGVGSEDPRFESIAKEMFENPPRYDSDGHENLMNDLAALVEAAHHFEFHDFKNTKFATPKVELRNQLLKLAQNVVDGRYDN